MDEKCGSGKFSASRVKIGFILLAAISIAFIAMSSAALGQVSYYTVSPTDLVQGEDVVISGQADPNEVVTVFITFEDATGVTDGIYSYPIYDISIPEGTEHFYLEAEGVDDLDIEVKIPLAGLYVPVPDRYITVENGIATFGTKQITFGTYSIIMSGNAPGEKVNIFIKARATITADENGYFEQTYNTENLPAGTYTITIDRANQQLTIRESPEDDGNSDDGDGSPDDGSSDGDDLSNTTENVAHGGSNTGTEFKIRPADSGEADEGTGDDSGSAGSLASIQESSEDGDSGIVEGSMLEKQTPSESSFPDVKNIGVVAVAIGLIGLGTIRYRKKSK